MIKGFFNYIRKEFSSFEIFFTLFIFIVGICLIFLLFIDSIQLIRFIL